MTLSKYKLEEIANIDISSVDKKTVDGEVAIKLCNFVDVYRNWAITKPLVKDFMKASANEKEIRRYSIQKGQVAITKDSETRDDIGVSTYIADDFEDVLLGYHCALITPNNNVVNGKYLNAFFHTSYMQKYFEYNASGSGQRYTLSLDTIKSIPILLPPIETQCDVGKLLANIDRKIQLKKSINHNLEAVAKQLYDYWFVQFDFPDENGRPYRSSGGKMVWNEKLKREIPEGWKVGPLNIWLDIKSGYPFKSDTYCNNGDFKIITIKNVQDHHLDTSNCDYIKELPIGIKEWCILDIGDIIISLTGNCGRLCIVTENNLLLNQRVGLLYCEDEFKIYAYLLLSSDEIQTMCEHLAKGAAQANLSPIKLCQKLSFIPKELTFRQFDSIVKPLFVSIIRNEMHIRILTKLRDELLPLLMNGQVSVNYDL